MNKKHKIIAITAEEFSERRNKICQLLNKSNYDAIFIAGGTNLLYFTGINGSYSDRISGLLLDNSGKIKYICPKFEADRIKELLPKNSNIFTWEEHESPAQLLKKLLNSKIKKIVIDHDIPFWQLEVLQEAMPNITFCCGTQLINSCRAIKSPAELALIKASNQITIEVFSEVFNNLKEGIKNTEVSTMTTELFKTKNISGSAFILFGEAAAYPHGTKYPQILKKGEIVLIDGGCRIEGYFSDITRSVIFGEPTKRQLKIWKAVADAQLEVMKFAKSGVACSKLDEIARKVIEKHGFGKGYALFSHRLGHGIGLNGHEFPYLVQGNNLPLQAGMTFSNEPGIYIAGEIGVRLEDCIYITETKAEFFTKPAKDIFSF